MHNRLIVIAALSAVVLAASACGVATPAAPPIVVSSTPVAGFGGATPTSQATAVVIPATGGTATATPTALPVITATPLPAPTFNGSPMPSPVVLPTASLQNLVIEIGVAQNAQYGAILVDGKGRTLYLRTSDAPRVSTCYGACAQSWPAAVPYGRKPSVLPGIDPTKLNSVVRTDGTRQVTFNDWPLYYYAGDTAPGQTNGQGSGGIWYVVTVNGDPVK